jgi:hypothetical protein
MMGDLDDYIKGNAIPIRSSKSFYQLGKRYIIRDDKARRIVQTKTGKKYFGSFKDYTEFAAAELKKVLK